VHDAITRHRRRWPMCADVRIDFGPAVDMRPPEQRSQHVCHFSTARVRNATVAASQSRHAVTPGFLD